MFFRSISEKQDARYGVGIILKYLTIGLDHQKNNGMIKHQSNLKRQYSYVTKIPLKAALANWEKVVKTGSIFMGRDRVMGRGGAESRLRGMGRGSVGAW